MRWLTSVNDVEDWLQDPLGRRPLIRPLLFRYRLLFLSVRRRQGLGL